VSFEVALIKVKGENAKSVGNARVF
jgi:hypothetical protein